MFHVPGKYSGAAGAGFEWTQTRETIELTVPLADGAKGAVTFGPRQLTVFATDGTGAEPVLDGELHDVVVVDDCVWTRDDSPRQLAISLRKAVPAVWTRLLRSDIEFTPALLDGQKRKGEPAAAGAPAAAAPAGGAKGPLPKSAAVPHVLSGLTGQSVVLRAADLPAVAVLLIRDCTDLRLTLAADATAVKVSADRCDGLNLDLLGKVTTETLELFRCAGASVAARTPLRTVQLDECASVALRFSSLGHFDRVVQQAVSELTVTFADTEALALHSGTRVLAALAADPERPEYTGGLAVEGEQFVTRLQPPPRTAAAPAGAVGAVAAAGAPGAAPPALLTEHVRRLANDFPSTLREAREHADRTRVRVGALGGGEGGAASKLLGSAGGDALPEEARAELARLAAEAEAEAAAAAAAADAAATAATELGARVAAKRGAGNAAFQAANWHEAAVRYTEALALLDSAPPGPPHDAPQEGAQEDAGVAVRSNRAAAFLKLGRYDQALVDCEAALARAPAHAKAAFRKGLALQALERFEEAIGAFAHAARLEPANKQVAAALRMAEMQLLRQRKQEG